MRKTKTEKGITLIALIITIVVLLILAAVAINSITNDGIISKAEGVADKYNKAVKEEQDMLDYYEGYLTGTTGKWVQEGTKVSKTTKEGTVTLTVGRTVTGYDGYSESYTGGWAVLGADDGKLLLVSKTNVKSGVKMYGTEGYTDNENSAGYNNVVEKLDGFCSSYKNSNLAEKVRSINVEDINRVTGYNPMSQKDGTIYGQGRFSEYGLWIKYTSEIDDDYVVTIRYESNNGSGSGSCPMGNYSFTTPWSSEATIDVQSTGYRYTGADYLKDSTAYELLFTGDLFYLADSCNVCDNTSASFGVRCSLNGSIDYSNTFISTGNPYWDGTEGGVRAVVVLNSDVTIDNEGRILQS